MNDIYLIGEVGYDITLQNVIDKVKASDESLPLTVNIHSQGGGVYEGLAIYNYLKQLDQVVHTKSSGLVASIASIIFLAGVKETRSINKTDSFLVHLPSGGSWGNAEDLEKTADELRDIEQKLANIYAIETSLTKHQAMKLMGEDNMLEVEFLLEKGFVNEVIELKAVAILDNKQTETMSKEQLTKEGAESLLEKFFNKFFPKNDSVENKVIQDANGKSINFTNLDVNDEINLEDVATIDEKKAEGDFTLPNGSVYTFTDGKLTDIKEADETEEEKLQTQNDDLKNQLETAASEIVVKDAEIITKDTEILELTNKVDEMKNEFTTLKDTITSNFEYSDKKKKKEDSATNVRTIFKEE